MIITRTPFRVSFFGGGTDYPVWYEEHGGAVLATAIDKYCYITCRYLPPFFEHRTRILYSKIENVRSHDEIEHPSARATLEFMNISEGLEIHHDGDLPARTGLGSSSAFTVGLLHALYALKNTMPTKQKLAQEAIHIEQNILGENVGCQDQILAAYGDFCRIDFHPAHRNRTVNFTVTPMIVSRTRRQEMHDHLLLFFTGFSRIASEVAKEQVDRTKEKTPELATMRQMVDEAIGILTGTGDIKDFGRLLNENWKIKRSLTSRISTPQIDQIYETALRAGALGGKLLGAGGGGFMLLFASPDRHRKIREQLNQYMYVPFSFEDGGSQIIFYQPSLYEDFHKNHSGPLSGPGQHWRQESLKEPKEVQ
ncbi:MAG: kinase [Elusimicrobia bacterium]|nr:kinase [Elusimicrobiota bacterium]